MRPWHWALALTVASLVLFELYARWPSSWEPAPLNLPRETRELVLVLHGSGGAGEPTLRRVTGQLRARVRGEQTVVRHHVWSPHADNIFRAAAHAQALGNHLGHALSALPNLERIHLVATSAGSHVLDPLCESYREGNPTPARVVMTFLDPIGTVGTWDYWYGYRNHGRCADFAWSVLNLDDAVPGTNAPLEQAYNLDVTALRGDFEDGHLWPVAYYLRHLEQGGAEVPAGGHSRLPRGQVRAETP